MKDERRLIACRDISRRGFFARLTAAFGWLTVPGATATQPGGETRNGTTTYSYDELGRLLSVTYWPGPQIENRKPKT